jgi:hypothetical protein
LEFFAYFTAIWNILQTFGIFYIHLVHLCSFGTFFPVWVSCTKKIWQPWMRFRVKTNQPLDQGCQIAFFIPKRPIVVIFSKFITILACFMAVRFIYISPFFVYFSSFWFVVTRKIWQPCSEDRSLKFEIFMYTLQCHDGIHVLNNLSKQAFFEKETFLKTLFLYKL